MILDDLKSLIVNNNIAKEEKIKFDFDSNTGEDVIILKLYNHNPCDLARKASINIAVKYNSLEDARNTCFAIHDILFPEDNFQKALPINGKLVHIILNSGPSYQEKDLSQRHAYQLDVTVIYNR